MVVLLLVACSGSSDGDLFHSSDGRYVPPEWGASDEGDTAGTDSGDTGSAEGDPGAPVFSNIVGEWTEYTSYGIVLEVKADYTDEGDDVDGGQCYIDATFGEDSKNFDGAVSSEKSGACQSTGGTLIFALQGLDDSLDTHVDFQVQDSSGNVSALYGVDVAGQ